MDNIAVSHQLRQICDLQNFEIFPFNFFLYLIGEQNPHAHLSSDGRLYPSGDWHRKATLSFKPLCLRCWSTLSHGLPAVSNDKRGFCKVLQLQLFLFSQRVGWMDEQYEIVYSKVFHLEIRRFRRALDKGNVHFKVTQPFLNTELNCSQKFHFDLRMCFLESRNG